MGYIIYEPKYENNPETRITRSQQHQRHTNSVKLNKIGVVKATIDAH